uniref:Putative secreted peptide n=1 Tax=Anopheles braziliensis TaxID=58242 RepID=A0A2M3ZQW7_9DIPT
MVVERVLQLLWSILTSSGLQQIGRKIRLTDWGGFCAGSERSRRLRFVVVELTLATYTSASYTCGEKIGKEAQHL